MTDTTAPASKADYFVNILDYTAGNRGKDLSKSLDSIGIHSAITDQPTKNQLKKTPLNVFVVILSSSTNSELAISTYIRSRHKHKKVAVLALVPRKTSFFSKAEFSPLYNMKNIIQIATENMAEASQTISRHFKQALAEAKGNQAKRQGSEREDKTFTLSDIADRIDLAATALEDIDLNSTKFTAGELRSISANIRSLPKASLDSGRSKTKYIIEFLNVIAKLFDLIEDRKMAPIVVCGAVTAVLGCTGWSATANMALTLAAWNGKDAFMLAVSKISIPKRNS